MKKLPPLQFISPHESLSALTLIDLQHFPLGLLSTPVDLYTTENETMEFCRYLCIASLELGMVLTVVVAVNKKMALVYPDLINHKMLFSYIDIEMKENVAVVVDTKIDYSKLIKNKISRTSQSSNLESLLLQSISYKFGNDGNFQDVEKFLDLLIPLLTG